MKIDFEVPGPPLTRDWGLCMLNDVWHRVLYGPEALPVRGNALTAIRTARYRLLSEMPKTVRDAHLEDY